MDKPLSLLAIVLGVLSIIVGIYFGRSSDRASTLVLPTGALLPSVSITLDPPKVIQYAGADPNRPNQDRTPTFTANLQPQQKMLEDLRSILRTLESAKSQKDAKSQIEQQRLKIGEATRTIDKFISETKPRIESIIGDYAETLKRMSQESINTIREQADAEVKRASAAAAASDSYYRFSMIAIAFAGIILSGLGVRISALSHRLSELKHQREMNEPQSERQVIAERATAP
jgi:hypothetical protein